MKSMAINIKTEQIEYLEEYLQNEKQSLKAREQDLKQDNLLVKQFINSISKDTEMARQKTEKESQRKE